MPFISIDIEASGPVPGLYDMISFGAVRVGHRDGHYFVTEDEIYLEIKPYYGGVDPEAMKVNRLDLEEIKANGVTLAEAAQQIRTWTKKGATRSDPPAFVGYCATFDWAFVNDMFWRTGVKNPFGYKALDIRALAMGVLALPWLDLKQSTILPRLGLEPLDPALAHNALVDARHQAKMLCSLLEKTGMTQALL